MKTRTRTRIAALVLAGVALLAGSACTPEEALWWDGYNGEAPGTMARRLCEMDPWGNEGLCPFPPASDAYATWMTLDGEVICFPEGWPNEMPDAGQPCAE